MGNFFTDLVSSVGEFFGIDEININKQIDEAIKEGEQQIKEERERLQAQLNSASSKERIAAEKEIASLEAANKTRIGQLKRDAIESNRKMDAEFKTKKESLDTLAQRKPTKPEFDRNKMLGLRDRAIRTPTVGPRPGQGSVMPRPTTTSGPRSGQAGGRRPR
jgi:hypothetical protein